MCVCMCVSLANDSSETIEVIIIKLGTVTASDTLMHHILIILTLTLIQGHTDLNHENINCLIISETTFLNDWSTVVLVVINLTMLPFHRRCSSSAQVKASAKTHTNWL